LLSGHLKPCCGEIRFEGKNITGMPPEKISHMGVGRSFQRTNIFPTLSCLDNCWLAAQSRMKNSFRFFGRSEGYPRVRERAEKALELCGLLPHACTQAGSLSYGEQRQLEIGMVMATEPRFLLLDEPMAGMGREESAQVVELLRELSKEYTLVLVEHDMDAVFSIAHSMTVMVNGQMLASGSLEQIRSDPCVQKAYLGDGEETY